jgi:hypothetical protein
MTLQPSPRAPKSLRLPSWGSAPLQRSRPAESVYPGRSDARHRPSPAFHTPSTACSSAGSRPFSGRCRSWGSPFRALLLSGETDAFRPVALLPFPVTPVLHSEVFGRSGFRAAPEPYSPRKVRTPRGCRPADRPMLSWDSAPPGLSSARHGLRFRRPTPTHFGSTASREKRGVACATGYP